MESPVFCAGFRRPVRSWMLLVPQLLDGVRAFAPVTMGRCVRSLCGGRDGRTPREPRHKGARRSLIVAICVTARAERLAFRRRDAGDAVEKPEHQDGTDGGDPAVRT